MYNNGQFFNMLNNNSFVVITSSHSCIQMRAMPICTAVFITSENLSRFQFLAKVLD